MGHIYTQWIDKLRRGKTRTAKLVVLADANKTAAEGEKLGDYLNTALDIQTAFNTLPAEHKAAIMLVSVEGYSYDEAASVLNIPVGTVASRVARARTLLGKLLAYERQHGLRQSKRHSGEQ